MHTYIVYDLPRLLIIFPHGQFVICGYLVYQYLFTLNNSSPFKSIFEIGLIPFTSNPLKKSILSKIMIINFNNPSAQYTIAIPICVSYKLSVAHPMDIADGRYVIHQHNS